MKIIIYNTAKNILETFYRNNSDPMPYSRYKFLSVNEFKSNTNHITIWTTKANMEAFNTLREKWRSPIKVGYAFKSITEQGHSNQSQHYVGLALDMGQNLSVSKRKNLHALAAKTGLYRYVEPIVKTPTWVHIDTRFGTPACASGYPTLKRGAKGVYVMALQDALRYKFKYNSIVIDGNFGTNTENIVKNFQVQKGLPSTGIVACQTWNKITN